MTLLVRSSTFHDLPVDQSDFIDVSSYAHALQRRWLVLILGAALGGGFALWNISQRPVAYQAVTRVLVVPTPPGGVHVTPATFRAIVENVTLAAQIIDELKLQDRVTPQQFVESALAVDEVRGTNVVKINVTLGDPESAASASRRLAEKAIELTRRITQRDSAVIQARLKTHLNDADRRLRAAENELLAYRKRARDEPASGDADAQLKGWAELLDLIIEIEAERARLSTAEAEIKLQPPLLPTTQSPAIDGSPHSYANPVYQILDFEIAHTRPRIATLAKQRDELLGVRNLGDKDLAQLNALYKQKIELARIQADFELATVVYADLAARYEESLAYARGVQVQTIDPALPPERTASRRRVQYAVFGGGTGFASAMLLVLLWDGLRRRRA